MTERTIQRAIVTFLRRVGCKVYVTSTNRPSRIAPGLPDVYAIHPQRGGFWVEAKAPGGRLSTDQRAFKRACDEAGVPLIVGGLDDVVSWYNNRTWWHDEPPAPADIMDPAYDEPDTAALLDGGHQPGPE